MDWKQRLNRHFRRLTLEQRGPEVAEAEYGRACEAYFREVVAPVLEAFADAVSEHGRVGRFDLRNRSADLVVTYGSDTEFEWSIESRVGAAGWMVYPVEISRSWGKPRRKESRFRVLHPDASFLLNDMTSAYLLRFPDRYRLIGRDRSRDSAGSERVEQQDADSDGNG